MLWQETWHLTTRFLCLSMSTHGHRSLCCLSDLIWTLFTCRMVWLISSVSSAPLMPWLRTEGCELFNDQNQTEECQRYWDHNHAVLLSFLSSHTNQANGYNRSTGANRSHWVLVSILTWGVGAKNCQQQFRFITLRPVQQIIGSPRYLITQKPTRGRRWKRNMGWILRC